MKPTKWCVCHSRGMRPSTWGKVISLHCATVEVEYGEDAPIWDSPYWDVAYTKFFDTEEEARKVVEDYEATVIYDPR